jgi:hypothetical protein
MNARNSHDKLQISFVVSLPFSPFRFPSFYLFSLFICLREREKTERMAMRVEQIKKEEKKQEKE